jgi:hypothetical protein
MGEMAFADQYTLRFVALLLIFAVGVARGLAALGAQRSERREILFSLGRPLPPASSSAPVLSIFCPEALTSYLGVLKFPLGFLIAALGFCWSSLSRWSISPAVRTPGTTRVRRSPPTRSS